MTRQREDEMADRVAEERSENEGMREHPAKGRDPIRWAAERGKRVHASAEVRSTHELLTARSATMGVGTAASSLEVILPMGADILDEAIAENALRALFSSALPRREHIRLEVKQQQVTLSGSAATKAERVSVEAWIGRIDGVANIISLMTVEDGGRTSDSLHDLARTRGSDQESADAPDRIEAVFVRESGLGTTAIRITAIASKVALRGQVHFRREHDLAERIAWATPGVTEVVDQITVC